MASHDWPRSTRPVIMGTHHMVSGGHYLAAAAGFRILEAGGNAIDAGVATGLCINVTHADLTNIGGVAPLMIYRADSGTVETISGLGWWPQAASMRLFPDASRRAYPPWPEPLRHPCRHRRLADRPATTWHHDPGRGGRPGH